MRYGMSETIESPIETSLAQCPCGEVAFVFTGSFVSWERCVSCAHKRLLAWSTYHTQMLVLGGVTYVR